MASPSSVCVYCGSSSRVNDVYKDAARQLGVGLARAGIEVVYGGGRVGLMGILADAALAAGGRVVGIIPEHLQVLEVDHVGLSELVVVDSMHARKRLMVERSDAFVVLPGGLGTLDETFEVVTWKQLRLHDKPIVIADIAGYWTPLLQLFAHIDGEQFVSGGYRRLFSVAADIAQVLDSLGHQPAPATPTDSRAM
ncbi:MAG: TIGR00730 family Rossman fold protein [Rhodospirillaceae bacterium]